MKCQKTAIIAVSVHQIVHDRLFHQTSAKICRINEDIRQDGDLFVKYLQHSQSFFHLKKK